MSVRKVFCPNGFSQLVQFLAVHGDPFEVSHNARAVTDCSVMALFTTQFRRTGFLVGLASSLAACAPGTEKNFTGGVEPPPTPGALSISISGLPDGVPAQVQITGPNGYASALTASGALPSLTPGDYLVAANTAVDGPDNFVAAPLSQTIRVAPGPTTTSASVSYTQTTASLSIGVSGLPNGNPARVTVTGPGGFHDSLTSTKVFHGLVPGTYSIVASGLTIGNDGYAPASATQSVELIAGRTPAEATVTYSIVTGALAIAVTGLPAGGTGSITVSGPGGYAHSLVAGETLFGLVPGTYAVAASPVTTGGDGFAAKSPSQNIAIPPSVTPTTIGVDYQVVTARLVVAISGLPSGANASVTVAGPNGFSQALTATQVLTGLEPGSYAINAAGVTIGGTPYQPAPTSQSVTLVASTAVVNRTVSYGLGTGTLVLAVNGLPTGGAAALTVTGPGGYSKAASGSVTLTNLIPGTYTIAAGTTSVGGQVYAPAPASQTATVSQGGTTTRTVTYSLATGTLSVSITGLPAGVSSAVVVTGPSGYNRAVVGTITLAALFPGSYTITAGSVTNGAQVYTATPPTQTASVTVGNVANASVTYSAGPPTTFNLSLDGFYLTQGIQRYDGTIPLVAGRDAYLRVFVKANQANSVAPPVRVRIYQSGSLVQTDMISAPVVSVPTAVDESTLSSSWNVLVPAALVQPGLSILADVDPASSVAESTRNDNQFPNSGVPLASAVQALPAFNVRFVPILQSSDGLQGNVSAGNLSQFMSTAKVLLPIAGYNADLRAPYTTNAPALVSDDANGSWGQVLSELLALRNATDTSSRYYYGVVKVSYSSGVAGLGYVGAPTSGFKAAIGWDYLPSASGVAAHEMGHNLGRLHAPCGGAASPDPAYPYAGGTIGVYGLDLASLSVKLPSSNYDLMGYCSPAWISDYNWQGMLNFRAASPTGAPPVSGSPTVVGASAGLLIWGRMTPRGAILEPTFRLEAPARMPRQAGVNRVEGLAADGSVLFSYPVDVAEVPDLPRGPEQHFAIVVPVNRPIEQRLVGIRLRGPSLDVSRISPVVSAAPPITPTLPGPDEITATPAGPGRVRIAWDSARYPMVMIRDPGTRDVLSFARGGTAIVHTALRMVQVTASDGVLSKSFSVVIGAR